MSISFVSASKTSGSAVNEKFIHIPSLQPAHFHFGNVPISISNFWERSALLRLNFATKYLEAVFSDPAAVIKRILPF